MLATTIITPTQVYWITRMDNISDAFVIIMIASIFALILLIVVICGLIGDGSYDSADSLWPFARCAIVATVISILGAILTPTTKEICATLLIPAVANNEKVQGLGEDFYDLAKEWMQELKPTKGESK